MKHPKFAVQVSALLLATPMIGLAKDAPLQFKQLAGPPTEFRAMAPPQPVLFAVHSKSALLPIALEKNDNGLWSWHLEVPIEGNSLRFLVFSDPASTPNSWTVMVRDRVTQREKSVQSLGVERRAAEFGMSDRGIPADYYEIPNLPRGNLQMSIESNEPGQGFILIEGAGPARLLSHQAAFNQRVGQRIGMVAKVYDLDKGTSEIGASDVSAAFLRVVTPDKRVLISDMLDDGLHQDGEAGDGIYGGDFLADRAGNFNAQVVLKGQESIQGKFVRTTEHLIPIVEESLLLKGQVAASRMVSEKRVRISLSVSAPKATGHYRVFAEVWGADASGNEVSIPVAWIGGMTRIQNGALDLGLDTRWIALSGAREPFELRNVRIEDPDYFISLATAERIFLPMPVLPKVSMTADRIVVDEEMLMGPRPPAFDSNGGAGGRGPKAYTEGTGHKLLLVHGYCSSDVWGPVSGQFSNDAVFLDLDQNRSHDAFAQRIYNFGLTWNSYAIVAHSQGGAAALHLYANYWSGLDNAGPGRLIQSVGTPYQGTNLAGILATIGSWFGKACGSNYDLTYSGAAAWLAGISSTYRAKVNYFTTSFTDDFGYDYCSAADLVLTDPDDGVTEKAWGQLSGAVNQGHKTGWCHSVNMRDPAQYTDSVRNASMSSSAAVGPPTMVTSPATAVGQFVATLNGTVNPNGASSTTAFEYGPTTAYGSSVAAQTRTGSTTQAISASPSLSCGTLYHFRARGTNSAGTRYGSDLTFTTAVCPLPVVTVSVADSSTGEPLNSGTFRILRSGSTSSSLTVYFQMGGSAGNGSDYSFVSSPVIIPSGSSSADVTVNPINDSAVEGTETVNLTLSANANYTLGSPSSGSLNLTDDDALPTVSVSVPDSSAGEPSNPGTFRIQRSGSTSSSLTVYFQMGGSAGNGSDYSFISSPVTISSGSSSADVAVNPINDSAIEGTESVSLTLSANANYTLGSPSSGSLNLTDDDALPVVTVSVPDSSAGEPSNPGTFRIQRSGSTSSSLTVYFQMGGSAGNGSDYSFISSPVTIPSGSSSADVTVNPINDSLVEGMENVTLTLTANASYMLGSPSSGNFDLTDDDSPPAIVVTVTALDPSASEPSDPGTFRISRTGSTASALTVSYSVAGSATSGTDYSPLSGSAVIPAGSSSTDVPVQPIDDTAIESDESVILNLSSGSGYIVGSPGSATVIIHSDDGSTGTGTDYYTLTPCRILDTRDFGPLESGITYEASITGFCAVPDSTSAVAVNVTAVTPAGPGYLAFWPAQSSMPGTSTVNFGLGQTRANNAILLLAPGYYGAAGAVWVRATLANGATVHLIIDVVGYFQ